MFWIIYKNKCFSLTDTMLVISFDIFGPLIEFRFAGILTFHWIRCNVYIYKIKSKQTICSTILQWIESIKELRIMCGFPEEIEFIQFFIHKQIDSQELFVSVLDSVVNAIYMSFSKSHSAMHSYKWFVALKIVINENQITIIC